MKHKHKKWIPLAILAAIGIAFLAGWVIQLLWNATITPIFGSNAITYWQGIMLLILFKVLFSSHYKVHKERSKNWSHSKAKFFHCNSQEEEKEEE